MIRVVRIVATATVLVFLFRLSRELTRSAGEEQIAGYTVAVGVVGTLFLVRAVVSEFLTEKVPVSQRDILWGLTSGAWLTLLSRLVD